MSYDANEAKKYIVNSYGRLDLVITHGEGVYLYDSDKNKYLDFTSGIGVSSLGYGTNPRPSMPGCWNTSATWPGFAPGAGCGGTGAGTGRARLSPGHPHPQCAGAGPCDPGGHRPGGLLCRGRRAGPRRSFTKPHPGGLLKLAEAWDISPSRMVMVGGYRFDLDCGRAAGTRTVLVNLPDNPWPELTDWHARDCAQLRDLLSA